MVTSSKRSLLSASGSGQQLDAEAQQLVCGYQTLEFFGEFAAFNWVAEP
jgi:hypothetical protein